MRGDEVVGEKLSFPAFFACGVEFALECKKIAYAGFAHAFQYVRNGVFRREFELARDVMARNFLYVAICAGFVRRDDIGAYAAGHEHVFNPGNPAKAAEKF
jgi:uncharacterized protein YbjT (DUF2867 family)